MNTKHKGNIGLANAISYFTEQGYFVFLPVGDNGGAIDIIVSPDGIKVFRVQCKYTAKLHTAMQKNYPDSKVWEVDLRQVRTRLMGERKSSDSVYNEQSFDYLYISTPESNYLIDWGAFCSEQKTVPTTIRLGKKAEKWKL